MNSKQRRQNARDKKFRGVEATVEDVYSARFMNDFCEYIFECRNNVFEWRCFGRYEECPRYQTGDLTLPVANL